MFLPFAPWVCSLVLLVVAMIYTMEAGFYGVVIADVFQMSIVVFAAIFVTIMAIAQTSAAGGLGVIASQVTGNAEWMNATPTWQTAIVGKKELRFDDP